MKNEDGNLKNKLRKVFPQVATDLYSETSTQKKAVLTNPMLWRRSQRKSWACFVVIALTAPLVPVPEPARIWSDLVRFHMQDVNPVAQA